MRVFAVCGPIGSPIKEFSQQFAFKVRSEVEVTIIDESNFLVAEDADLVIKEEDTLIPAEYNKKKSIDYARLKEALSREKGVVILRGHYLFADESLRKLFDVKIFVSTDGDTCLANYLQNVKPTTTTLGPVLDFFEKDIKVKNDEEISKLQKHADITIPAAKIDGPGMSLLLSNVDGFSAQAPKESKSHSNFFVTPTNY